MQRPAGDITEGNEAERLRERGIALIRGYGVLAREGPEAGWCFAELAGFKIRWRGPFGRGLPFSYQNPTTGLIVPIRQKYWEMLEIYDELGALVISVGWSSQQRLLFLEFDARNHRAYERFLRGTRTLAKSGLGLDPQRRLTYMATRIDRPVLRRYAREALEQRGIVVEQIRRRGLVPGVRLKISEPGKKPKEIAVRTSRDRKVALMRSSSGDWRTVSTVKEVVVAVPALNDPSSVEVLFFYSDTLIQAFDELILKTRNKKGRKKDFKAPVFIALDSIDDDPRGGLASGLKSKAVWSVTLPLGPRVVSIAGSAKEAGFMERVRREFAELMGTDISKVIVSLHIVG
jgi:hypothetical protein